jgi:uncharacterized delta-60 repeat protein
MQQDGRLIVGGSFTTLAGNSRNRVARLNSNGSIDISFNPGADGSVETFAVQKDGKILVGGWFSALGGIARNSIARLNEDGTLDTSFNSANPEVNGIVYSIALQADGKILVGGSFTTLGGQTRNNIARLNADGSLDASFNPGANGNVYSIAVQADEKIVLGGTFTTLGGQTRNRIARLNENGSLDASFNPGANNDVNALAIQADGKILAGGAFGVLGGQSRWYIARINSNGSLDTSFNSGADNHVQTMTIQADGKILVGGWFSTLGGQTRNRIGRLNADGSLDTSFALNGSGSVDSLAVQPDGKILVGGDFNTLGGQPRNRIARINNNTASSQTLAVTSPTQIDWIRGGGAPEVEQVTFETWNGSTWVSVGAATRVAGGWRKTGLSLPASGWIRAIGRSGGGYRNGSSGFIAQVLYYGSGQLPNIVVTDNQGDPLISAAGTIDFGTFTWPDVTAQPQSITITNSGEGVLSNLAISVGGQHALDFTIGTLATTTLAPGESTSFEVGFSAQGGGARGAELRIVSDDPAGSPYLISLFGNVPYADPSFSLGADNGVAAIALQSEGKILAGGSFSQLGGQTRPRIARINADGSLDSGFNPGAHSFGSPSVTCVAVQRDGKTLVGGDFTLLAGQARNRIARLNADGSLDASFNPGANGTVYSIAIQADGKIVLGGSFTTLGGQTRNYIARLNADGTLDAAFNPGAGSWVFSLAMQADGKILVGGIFTTLGGQTRNRIARINVDGSLDVSFNPDANGGINSLAPQPDGKVLVGGGFTTMGGQTRNRIARLNADGSLDSGFNPGTPGSVSSVSTLALQADGKILLGGIFSILGPYGRANVARINSDGNLDHSFDPSAGNAVYAITIQSDGKILVGGGFTTLGGATRNRIARLNNNIASTQSLTVVDTTQIDWTRGGSAPEVEQVTFERWNGSEWVSLGAASRITGGWRMTGLSLPPSGQIRARGRSTGGQYNGSSSLIEQVAAYSFVPEIAVSGNGVDIANGDDTPDPADHTDFGQVSPSGGSLARVFTITNNGGGDLNLTGTPRVDISGSTAFSVTQQPASDTVTAGGGTQTFEVTFAPTSPGVHNATISIASNDPDENPFTFVLTGLGNTAPTFAGYSVSTPWQTAASLSLGKLLAKAADADGDALSVTAAGPASAQGGTAVLGGTLLYTPPTGFSGTDTFPVTITDAHGATVEGTVTVTVGPNPNAGGQGVNVPTVTMVDGKAQLRFRAIPGTSYQIQRSIGDLNSWQDMVTLTTDSTGVLTWTDPSDPPPPNAFYRVRLP